MSSFLVPKISQKTFGDVPLNITVVTYTDAFFISLGTRGLLGFMHETVSSNPGLTPESHRILLGDRDDLVSALFAERLSNHLIKKSGCGVNKVITSLSVPKELLMNKETADSIIDWTLSCLSSSD